MNERLSDLYHMLHDCSPCDSTLGSSDVFGRAIRLIARPLGEMIISEREPLIDSIRTYLDPIEGFLFEVLEWFTVVWIVQPVDVRVR